MGRILGSRGVEPETVERVWAAMLRELERLEREGSPTSSAHAARFLVEHALGADDVETVEALRADLENPPGRPQRLRLVDGAVELLTWLHGQGIACGILSNSGLSSGAYNVEWMRRSGILPLFAEGAVLFSDEIGVAKPARAAFDLCRERLGCEADELLHVGDDLWADVHGARSAGLATARVSRFTTPQELPDADIVVESLSQLRPVYA